MKLQMETDRFSESSFGGQNEKEIHLQLLSYEMLILQSTAWDRLEAVKMMQLSTQCNVK